MGTRLLSAPRPSSDDLSAVIHLGNVALQFSNFVWDAQRAAHMPPANGGASLSALERQVAIANYDLIRNGITTPARWYQAVQLIEMLFDLCTQFALLLDRADLVPRAYWTLNAVLNPRFGFDPSFLPGGGIYDSSPQVKDKTAGQIEVDISWDDYSGERNLLVPKSTQPAPNPQNTGSGQHPNPQNTGGGGGKKPPDPDASNDTSSSGSQTQVTNNSAQQPTGTQETSPTSQPIAQSQGVDDSRVGNRPVGKPSFHVQQVIGYSDDGGGATGIHRGGGVRIGGSGLAGARPDPESTGGSSGGGGGQGGDQGRSSGGDFGGGFGGGGNFSTNKNKNVDNGDTGTADPIDSGGDDSSGGNSDPPKSGDAPKSDRSSGTVSDAGTGFIVQGQEVNTGTTYKEFPDPDSGDAGEGAPGVPSGRGRPRPPSFQDPNRGLSRAKLRMLLAMARESGYQSGDDWGAGGYNPRFSSGSNADPETTGSRRGADPWSGGGGSSDSGGPDFFSGGGTPTTSQWSYGPPLWSDSDDYWSDYNPHYRPFGNTSWAQAPTATTTSTPVNLQSRLRALSPTALIRLK